LPIRRSTTSILVLLAIVGSSLAALAALAEPGATPIFTDISAGAGVSLPGTLNESLAWGDYDNDGDQDLYLTNNGENKLFRNDGAGAFSDVTATAGVGHTGFSVGTAFGDLDNDGDLDLYVVTFSTGLDALYRNDGPVGPGGAYTFTDIAATAGIVVDRSSRGVAMVDHDKDGLLDLYVNAIGDDILYRNLGGLQFQDVASTLGVPPSGQGVGIVATDVDHNGWIDLFTGNRSSEPNSLFMQDQGTFIDVAQTAGIDELGLGMGVLSFDYDNDLDFDLYWTTWPGSDILPQPNALYENVDGDSFTDVAQASGTADPDGWGISCNAGDANNDGWEDFFVTNGFSDTSTPNVLFVNQGDGSFADETVVLGGGQFDGRGAAFADIDNDGDLDLCVTAGVDDDTRLWRNETATTDRWVVFDLQGTCSNRSAIGARIEVTTDLRTTVKEVSGGAGRGSQNSLPVEFGLGSATAVLEVTVFWPSGIVQRLAGVALDQYHAVVEPCGSLTLFVHDRLVRWARPDYKGGTTYDVVRGDLTTLRQTDGDFLLATQECLASDHADHSLSHTATPAPGDGSWYLVRELDNGSGTYDEPSGSQVGFRDPGIDASAGARP